MNDKNGIELYEMECTEEVKRSVQARHDSESQMAETPEQKRIAKERLAELEAYFEKHRTV